MSTEDAETSLPSLLLDPMVAVIYPVSWDEWFPIVPDLILVALVYTLAVLGAVDAVYWAGALLFNMWVNMSFVYFNLFVISALLLSRAWLSGMIDRSPFLFT